MQLRIAIAVGLSLALFASGLFLGKQWGQASSAARESSQLSKQMDAVIDQGKKTQDTLDKLPKGEGKIREIVREYPAPCPMPPPVADGLQDAARKGNSARKVPSDF